MFDLFATQNNSNKRYVARLKDADGPIFDSSEESQQSQPTYQNTVKKKPAKPARLKLGSGKHRNNPPWAFKYGKDQVRASACLRLRARLRLHVRGRHLRTF